MKTTKNITREGKIVERDLYHNTVKVEYNDGWHAYRVNGEKVKFTVSGIVGDSVDGLLMWAVKIVVEKLKSLVQAGEIIDEQTLEENKGAWKDHRQELADIGTAVHNWIEQYVAGMKPEYPEDERALNGVLAFLKLVDEKGMEFVENEKIVYSKENKYIGIMDVVFTMASENHQIYHAGDWKTGKCDIKKLVRSTEKRAWEKDRYQLAGYQFADTEESGRVYGNGWLFYIDKNTGEFSALELKDQEKDFIAFKCRLFLKQREAELKKNDWQSGY